MSRNGNSTGWCVESADDNADIRRTKVSRIGRNGVRYPIELRRNYYKIDLTLV